MGVHVTWAIVLGTLEVQVGSAPQIRVVPEEHSSHESMYCIGVAIWAPFGAQKSH